MSARNCGPIVLLCAFLLGNATSLDLGNVPLALRILNVIGCIAAVSLIWEWKP